MDTDTDDTLDDPDRTTLLPRVPPLGGPGEGVDPQQDDTDPWAWMERPDDEAEHVDLSGCEVTAVLVTLDAARWLPETLASLAGLSHRPDRLVAVDTGSADTTALLLQRARDVGVLDAVYTVEGRPGFGAAVASALAQDAARSPAPSTGTSTGTGPSAPAEPRERWLWLLHDDAVVGPHTLERLLTHVTTDPAIDVTGPKLLLPKRRHSTARISEIGVSISGTGRREVLLDSGEIDQGQRDEPRPRLGVSTCGMLVRQEVWEALGGLDPLLPVFRDGVEFGWRAHLAGHTVVTTPTAEVTHRQVGRAGLRPRGAAGRRPYRLDRSLGLLVVAGHARTRALPLVWVRLVWSCLLRALGYLVGKAPRRSLDELAALAVFVGHPGRVRALRRRVRSGPTVDGASEVVQRLRPPWWSGLRVAAEAVSGALSDRYRSVAGDLDSTSLDELTGDDFAAATEEEPRYPWLSPVVVSVVLSVVASLVAARRLFGGGSLTAPALLPAQTHLGDLWRSVWEPVLGAPDQSSPPWLALSALGSTVLAGRPEWFVTLLLCAVVPITLLTAYPVARRTVHGRRVRLWVAVTYALLPVLLGGTNQGRLSLSVFAVLLPLLVLAARALVLRRPRAPEAWRGGWGAGVVLVALVAFEPAMMVFALVAGALGAFVLRRTPRKAGRVGIAVALPLLVWAPWWPSVVSDWGRLFTGPDAALGGAPAAPAVWPLLLGRPGGAGLPPLWVAAVVFGSVWLVALVGLARRPRSRAVLAGWVTALLALAVAVLLSRLVVTVPPVGAEVRPWVGPWLLVAFGALVLAGGIGGDGWSAELGRRSFSWLQPAVVAAGAVAGLVTLLGAGWWVWGGATGPVERQRLDALPPYVVNALRSPDGVRALAVDVSGSQARYSVVADDQVRLGDADRGFAFGGSTAAPAEAADLVVRLLAGTADADIAPQLRELGIGFVWVRGADEEDRARIANTPGLGTASGSASGTVWQLDPAVTRASLSTGADGTWSALGPAPVSVPPGDADRLLRLGQPADPRWRATLDGVALTPVTDGWQQAFRLPATGGTVRYHAVSYAHWFLFAQAAVLLVAAVLAAPGIRRPEVRDPARSARRAATLGQVPA